MIDVLTLRTDIADWLEDYLGVYTFKSGASVAAIAVLPDKQLGYDYPPPETTVTGIECVIIQPNLKTEALLGNDLGKRYQWLIYLKQWDVTGNLSETTEVLIDNLTDNDYQFSSPNTIIGDKTLGILASVKIPILDNIIRAA